MQRKSRARDGNATYIKKNPPRLRWKSHTRHRSRCWRALFSCLLPHFSCVSPPHTLSHTRHAGPEGKQLLREDTTALGDDLPGNSKGQRADSPGRSTWPGAALHRGRVLSAVPPSLEEEIAEAWCCPFHKGSQEQGRKPSSVKSLLNAVIHWKRKYKPFLRSLLLICTVSCSSDLRGPQRYVEEQQPTNCV